MARFSNLGSSTASFENMMKRFGVVTVMNATVYDTSVLPETGKTIKEFFDRFHDQL